MKIFENINTGNVITIVVIVAGIIMGYTQLKDEVRFINKDAARIQSQLDKQDNKIDKNNDRIHAIEINVSAILTQLEENGKKLDKLLEGK